MWRLKNLIDVCGSRISHVIKIFYKKREKKVGQYFVALMKKIAIIIFKQWAQDEKKIHFSGRRLGKVRYSKGAPPNVKYSRVSNPVSAFAYLADDGRQELDSLSSDVQVRISSTRYGCLCRVPVVSFLHLGAIFLPRVGASRVYILCMHYGRSHGHTRAMECTGVARARALTRLQVGVEEPLMNLPVFLDRPCVLSDVSRRRGERVRAMG